MKHLRGGFESREFKQPGSRVVTPAWLRAHEAAAESLRASRENDPNATTSLLIVASQHPLIDGKLPNGEYQRRLEAAQTRFDEITGRGAKAEILLLGSRHHDADSGATDRVALYDAGGKWLVDHGISPGVLHGKDWIDAYRPEGVYSGAAEIDVAAAGFINHPSFRDAEYFCSPRQVSRARMYALAYGLPLTVTVPESLMGDDSNQFKEKLYQKIILRGLTRTIDPYGEGALVRLTKDRIPQDGNIGTTDALLDEYAALPWYSPDAEQ